MRELKRQANDLRDRILKRYILLTTPTASGLPNWRVVTWFPALAALGTLVLIILHISGTSSGMHWNLLGTGEDPRLIIGSIRSIRSDEYLVQQSWVVSQFNTGFGAMNPTFPGGSDMTLFNELPSWHWSSILRPHLWGYLFFGLDAGIAWHWWIPALVLVSGCYLLVVTMLPRRPLTAAFFAVALFFTPLLQWWYTPSSVMPVAWTCLTLAGIIWIIVDKRLWVRVIWSALIGYFATTTAIGLYVPFIIPGLYIVLAFGIGYALRVRPWQEIGVKDFLRRLVPLVTAGVAAVTLLILFVISRWPAISAIQSTTYPGHRLYSTGMLLPHDPYLVAFAGAPWGESLRNQSSSILGPNSSEGSSAILLCLFVLPGLIWFAISTFKRSKQPDWLLLSMLGVLLLFSVYLVVPGWDGIAHLLQLDKVSPERFRIAFAILAPVFAVLVIDHVDRHPAGRHWRPGLLSAVFTTGIMGSLYLAIRANDPSILVSAPMWKLTVLFVIAATFFIFLRRAVPMAAALIMLTSMLIAINVNPLYRGIFNLSTTEVGQEIVAIDNGKNGDWVGIGTYEVKALLTQTGVGSYTGVQNYPSEEMWDAIDPESRYEEIWNRLAHIHWIVDTGEPVVSMLSTGIIGVTFDACSIFAQEHVAYVLTDAGPIESECLVSREVIQQGVLTMRIYEVVPEP